MNRKINISFKGRWKKTGSKALVRKMGQKMGFGKEREGGQSAARDFTHVLSSGTQKRC